MFKIETHLHTKYVSPCSQLSAEEIALAYHNAGYAALFVTDHYNRRVFDILGIDIYSNCDKLTPYLEGYRRLKEACLKYGIYVLKGAEVRLDESDNDYLVFNWHNDLLKEPAEVFSMKISDLYAKAHEAGTVVIQAHPYRDNCTPAIARYLDGVEVVNAHPDHDSRNDLAKKYAYDFGLIGISGSDAHKMGHMCRGGIVTDENPKEESRVSKAILYRHFELILPQ